MRHTARQRNTQRGFTIVELMIAVAVFGVILMGATTAVIQIGRMYHKGIISARTQQTTRRIMDDITRPIQFAGRDIAGINQTVNYTTTNGETITVHSFCLGNDRYSYVLNRQVYDGLNSGFSDQSNQRLRHALWRDRAPDGAAAGNCTPCNLSQDVPCGEGEELLEQFMRIKNLTISNLDGTVYNVGLEIIYGDSDLIEFADAANTEPITCKGAIAGSQWCAISGLQASVLKRIQ